MTYVYTKLRGPFEINKKYNVYGVVKQIKKKTSETNGKLSTKFSIVDETIIEPFYVTIFCRTRDEVIPEITEGSIIRLHRMMVESFNNIVDGRVFSPSDVAIIPKALLASLDWVSSAKKFTITDSDNDRVIELTTWMETVADLPELIDDVFTDGVRGNTAKISNGQKVTFDKSTQTEVPVSHSQPVEQTGAFAHSLVINAESRKRRKNEVPNFEPSVADLSQAGYKDLLVWKCTCGRQARTSQLLWCPGPKTKKHLGSTKCRDCGAVGLAIPQFHFYVRRSEESEGQPERRLMSGEEACESLGTNILLYTFDDSESNKCNRHLITLMQSSILF